MAGTNRKRMYGGIVVSVDDELLGSMLGYEAGPALGMDLLEFMKCDTDHDYYSSDAIKHVVFTSGYYPRRASPSVNEFCRWYARMAYTANHQANLETSYLFWDRLNQDASTIVNAFMEKWAFQCEDASISVSMLWGHPESNETQAKITFTWRDPDRSDNKKIKVTECE